MPKSSDGPPSDPPHYHVVEGPRGDEAGWRGIPGGSPFARRLSMRFCTYVPSYVPSYGETSVGLRFLRGRA